MMKCWTQRPNGTSLHSNAKTMPKRYGYMAKFARRIDVPQDTIRNWEQGKRRPTGAAKALLRVLDKAPETALFALR